MKKAALLSIPVSLALALLGFFLSWNASASPSVQSLWSNSVPAHADSSDPNSVNVGLRFHSSVPGQILGIRFYKGPGNTGTHVGSLWSSSGQRLGGVTFSNETAAGWQVAHFATPISIAAFTTYDASYLAPHGHYAYDNNYFGTARQSGNLVAEQAKLPYGNGVYTYSGATAFPATASKNLTNYWVDVLFQPSSIQSCKTRLAAASARLGSSGISLANCGSSIETRIGRKAGCPTSTRTASRSTT